MGFYYFSLLFKFIVGKPQVQMYYVFYYIGETSKLSFDFFFFICFFTSLPCIHMDLGVCIFKPIVCIRASLHQIYAIIVFNESEGDYLLAMGNSPLPSSISLGTTLFLIILYAISILLHRRSGFALWYLVVSLVSSFLSWVLTHRYDLWYVFLVRIHFTPSSTYLAFAIEPCIKGAPHNFRESKVLIYSWVTYLVLFPSCYLVFSDLQVCIFKNDSSLNCFCICSLHHHA